MGSESVFRANGSAFWSDGSASYYIEEGTLTDTKDAGGRRLVSMHGGSMYMPFDGRWRATKSEALRDARDAVSAHAKRMQQKADEIERQAQEASATT
jgi:hypothetical protein